MVNSINSGNYYQSSRISQYTNSPTISPESSAHKETNNSKDVVSTLKQAIPDNLKVPNWVAKYTHGSHLLNHEAAMQETRSYQATVDNMMSDGVLSLQDKQKMSAYWDNMPETQNRRHLDQQAEIYSSELAEYNQIFRSYYESSLSEHDIVTETDYVEKVINAPGHNEALHHSVKSKLLDDPRALELMGILGIAKPIS